MRSLLLLALTLLLALPAGAAELLIIQSHSNEQYDQAVRLIQNNCGKRYQTYIMSNYAEFDLGRIVREEQPRVIIAVGDKSLKEAQKLRGTAVIYTMALAVDEENLRSNISGISMHADPEYYLKLLKKLKLRKAGIVYSKAKSSAYVKRAKKDAKDYNIELVLEEISSPQEVATALNRLSESGIDSIWMLPDTTAVTAETLSSYFYYGQRGSIPVISFSRTYLDKGALAAVEASRVKMIEQLCSNVNQLLDGAGSVNIRVRDISEASLYTNETVAHKLNISLPQAGRFSPSPGK